jgi:ABC-type glycerol-3-phosphate transport system permease component
MAKSPRKTSKVSLVVLSVLAVIWLMPTIGLLITSVRERTEAQAHRLVGCHSQST